MWQCRWPVWLQVLLSTYCLVAIPLHCPCTTIGPTIPCDWRENIYVYIAMEYPQTPVPGRRQHLPDPPPRFLPPCLKSHCKSIAFSVASGFSVILLHFPSRCTLPPYFFLALYYLVAIAGHGHSHQDAHYYYQRKLHAVRGSTCTILSSNNSTFKLKDLYQGSNFFECVSSILVLGNANNIVCRVQRLGLLHAARPNAR